MPDTTLRWDPHLEIELPALTGSWIDGDWVGAIVMRKTYTEGLVGESVAHFVSSGTEEGGRGYLAAERITGRLEDGRSGSLTVRLTPSSRHGRSRPSRESGTSPTRPGIVPLIPPVLVAAARWPFASLATAPTVLPRSKLPLPSNSARRSAVIMSSGSHG